MDREALKMGRSGVGSASSSAILLTISLASLLVTYQLFQLFQEVNVRKVSTEDMYTVVSTLTKGSNVTELPINAYLVGNSSALMVNGKEVLVYNETALEVPGCFGAEINSTTFSIIRHGDVCRIIFRPFLNLSSGEILLLSAENSGSFRRFLVSSRVIEIKGYIESLTLGSLSLQPRSPLILRVKIYEVRGCEC
jgi:hypothetical protein